MQKLGGFLISKLKQLHSRSLAQCISEQGIDAFSGEQGKILFVLWQKDKITQKELASETGLAKNTITAMLEKMEKNNLIKRITDENDKRKSLVILTEHAKSLKKCSDKISDKIICHGIESQYCSKNPCIVERISMSFPPFLDSFI